MTPESAERMAFNSRTKEIVRRYYHAYVGIKKGTLMVFDGRVNGLPARILVDTGASISVVQQEFAERYRRRLPRRNVVPPLRVRSVHGEGPVTEKVHGVSLQILDGRTSFNTRDNVFLILPNFEYQVILGLDWLRRNSAVIDAGKESIRFRATGSMRGREIYSGRTRIRVDEAELMLWDSDIEVMMKKQQEVRDILLVMVKPGHKDVLKDQGEAGSEKNRKLVRGTKELLPGYYGRRVAQRVTPEQRRLRSRDRGGRHKE